MNNYAVQLKEKIKNLPAAAGVYVMIGDTPSIHTAKRGETQGAGGEIIYIGKAKNLKNRVSSYWRGAHDGKVTAMVSHITDVEFFVAANENDALFLEASLIHKHKPHYNILLKDDKRFPYIRVAGRKIDIVRKAENAGKNGGGAGTRVQYFGPYFNGIRASVLLDIIRTVYNNDPERAKAFLRGELNGETQEVLTARMDKAVEMQQFELAIAYRNALRMLPRLTRKVTATSEDADVFSLGACRELGEILGLEKTPRRIECYDISHTAGENIVGSMVVFIDGAADKSKYRKFKIRHGMGNNDCLSLNEVLTRRLKHMEWGIPAVIVIDGGKGQLSATAPVIAPHGITVISLAKQFELIYTTKSAEPIVLSKHSYALRLLQRIRDEAHRFAITFHKKLRAKEFVSLKSYPRSKA